MSSRPKVFISRMIPQVGLDMVAEVAEMDVWPEQMPPAKSVIMERIADCEGLLSLLTDEVDGALMDAAPKLKVVSNYAVGFNNIDVDAATARGVLVGNTPGVLTGTTADLAWSLLMSIARRIVEGDKYVRARQWKTWEPQLLLGSDVYEATIGIIGFGRIGQAMARRAAGFDMRIVYTDIERNVEAEKETGAEFMQLDDLLRASDFVTIHTLLNDDTFHLIGAREFELMGPDSYLINSSRGPVVDETALYEALKNETIRGAALDVTEEEPIPDDSPLLELDNVVIVPHIGSASRQTRNKMARMAAANLIAGITGEPLPNCVNPEAAS
ncbi:MAG TPA: D-glycerate dehydrogenase [Armatimonadetes bacterium]|nr:D-glycerate dehydrogenase [Armatimonadota bacterium]